MDLDQVERLLQERLDALARAPRAELLHVLMLPDFDRAYRIGEEHKDEEQDGEEVELTFSEMMLSDIAEDIGKVRRNRGFLAAALLVYILVVAASFLFVVLANVVN